MRHLQRLNLRRGLVVVVSDFFDPRGAAAVVRALKTVRHRLLLVQLAKAADREPEVTGEGALLQLGAGLALGGLGVTELGDDGPEGVLVVAVEEGDDRHGLGLHHVPAGAAVEQEENKILRIQLQGR